MDDSQLSSLDHGKREREEKRLNIIKRFKKLRFIQGNPEKLKKILEIMNFKDKPIKMNELELVLLEPAHKYQAELQTSEILEFTLYKNEKYEITKKGKEFLTAKNEKQQEYLSKTLLTNDLYRDLLFNMRISKDRTMPERQVGQNFYQLFTAINEEERNAVVNGLINFALYAEIIDRIERNGESYLRLLGKGEIIYDQIVQEKRVQMRNIKENTRGKRKNLKNSTLIPTLQSRCFNCDKIILSNYQYCPYCAIKLRTSCQNCGKQLLNDWNLCPYCATPKNIAVSSEKKEI